MNAPAPVDPPTSKRRWGNGGWVFVAVTLTLAGIVAWTVAPQTVGEKARRTFLRQLQDHYPQWRVTIGRGTYETGVGFVFSDVELSQPMVGGGSRQGFWVDRMVVDAAIDPADAVARVTQLGQPPGDDSPAPLIRNRSLHLQGVRLVTPVAAGERTVAIAGLWPPPQVGPACPVTRLSDVTISMVPVGDSAPPARQVHLADALIRRGVDDSQRIELRGSGEAVGSFGARITIAADRNLEVAADAPSMAIDEDAVRWAMWVAGVEAAPPRHLRLPVAARVSARQLDGIWEIRADANPSAGSLDDPRLPAALTNFGGQVRWTGRSLRWDNVSMSIGSGTCQTEGTADWSTLAPGQWPTKLDDLTIQTTLRAENLVVGPELASRLPPRQAAAWEKTRPTGPIDAALSLRYPAATSRPDRPWRLTERRPAATTWSIDGAIRAGGLSVRVAKFPYPVGSVNGDIELSGGRITAKQLIGTAGGQTLRCRFDLPLPPELGGPADPRRLVVVTTDGPLPIDDSLIGALTNPHSAAVNERGQSPTEAFIRSLHPRGAVQLSEARLSVDAAGDAHKQIDLRVAGGTLRYDAFAYPLYDVSGRVKIEDDSVRLIGFTAANAGNASVAADGLFTATGGLPPELNLNFRIADLDLDQPLRVALPPDSREIWDSISPSGVLDDLELHLHRIGVGPLQLVAKGEQMGSDGSPSRASMSIRPTALPYRIDISRGSVAYRDGLVTIADVRGHHGQTRLDVDGSCGRDEAGQWMMELTHQPGSRLLIDSSLIAAVPPGPASALMSLDLRAGRLAFVASLGFILPTRNGSVRCRRLIGICSCNSRATE